MGIRNQVKQALRMCGHAVVSTVHERLDNLERQVNDLGSQNASLAETQTALLQAAISLVENVRRVEAACQGQEERLRAEADRFEGLRAEIAHMAASTKASDTVLLAREDVLLQEVRRLTQDLGRQADHFEGLRAETANMADSTKASDAALLAREDDLLQEVRRLARDLGRPAERSEGLMAEVTSLVATIKASDAALLAGEDLLLMEVRRLADDLGRQAGRLEGLHAEVTSLGATIRASDATLLAGEDLLHLGSQQQMEALRTQQASLATLGTDFASLAASQKASEAAVLALERGVLPVIERERPPRVSLETNDYEFLNPEIGLMTALYSSLPTRRAVDAGAHIGDISERLLTTGYEVYAFEPNPAVFEKLTQRLGGRQAFHPFRFALGPSEAELPLHLAEDLSGSGYYEDVTLLSSLVLHSLPEGLVYTSTVPVSVRRLADLHRSGTIPEDVSLVKIDTEGFDLDVIHGMDDYTYPVVVAEFWDPEFPFGRSGVPYTLESLTEEMRRRGYPYHIVIYRLWGQDQSAYYCNRGRSVPNSWGNVFFFRDYTVFSQGQAWCSAVLPATHFRPMSSH